MTTHWDEKYVREGLTFDDVLLIPAHSQVIPAEVDVTTWLTRSIRLDIPIVSAAMDTVTEHRLAIALARQGGIGFVHKNMTIEQQAESVRKVKRSESGMITDPITLPPDRTIGDALDIMAEYKISGVPIVTDEGDLVGIITNRDLRFEIDRTRPIHELMTSKNLVTVPEGTTLEQAKEQLHRHRIEKVLVVNNRGKLTGLITVKDIMKQIEHPQSCKDDQGRLRVGAAIGAGGDYLERAAALVRAGVDVLTIDTAHGHSQGVLDAVLSVREAFPQVQLIAGNVSTAAATVALAERGVDAVKVGQGPGSICTTRVVTGSGMPQVTAITDCARAAEHFGIPVIGDGGIKYSGDIAKAIAAGANSVMIGSLFAGTEESPGETILYEGRSYKTYRGMGSIGAMSRGSGDRYFQTNVNETRKLVAEGIEGMVPFKGSLQDTVFQLVGGLRAGMGYVGAPDIETFRRDARLIRVTMAGQIESHPHDVVVTKEAPNYERR
ncbi:IMP dehydrogenase [Candidatus Chloroploca asiatica]|uniref:Inosine-5'-monophosphate dehydrogenase n=1 Tax=Candidatus Chloroploca asiatica TaxID=1506545 RepID=A0A2H3KJ01_9CHLR|nr:IMP dehydrogenase [Candidatus Chloroploca asiatica]PDV97128.1 IMP dehydrogenase [Candidatus Chloroploca asiatica]